MPRAAVTTLLSLRWPAFLPASPVRSCFSFANSDSLLCCLSQPEEGLRGRSGGACARAGGGNGGESPGRGRCR